ncbi:MAG: DUF3387 domain-containing protein, partial [Clostridiales bacterium]|nr:DUF3387 domain-containing protein [Clostridiales bacterium]
GNSKNENFYEDLIDFVDDLKEESERHVREGLSEKELEIFDLLKKENLTKKEEQQVKLSAKKLYETITKDDSATKIVDWYKDEQPRWRVRSGVEEVLDEFLPQSYSKDMFNIKTDIVFAHIVEEAMKGRQYAS